MEHPPPLNKMTNKPLKSKLKDTRPPQRHYLFSEILSK